jgi:anti-anti-sigma factor
MTTARNRAIDRIRRDRTLAAKLRLLEGQAAANDHMDETDEMEFPDERLELIFTCCHPALSVGPGSRVGPGRAWARRRRRPTSTLACDVQSQFRVEVRRTEHATVLAVSGELDLASSTELEEELDRLDDSGPALVVLDLREVAFMDSAGLAVVVKAHQRAESAGRRFGLVNGSPQVQRLLSLTRMDKRITVAHTPEELLGGG